MQFTKPAKTYDEQIALLRHRKMDVDNERRAFHVLPTLPRITKYQFINTSSMRPDKAFYSFSIMAYMLERITPRSYFTGKLISLLHRFKEIDVRPAGFYTNWHLDPFLEIDENWDHLSGTHSDL